MICLVYCQRGGAANPLLSGPLFSFGMKSPRRPWKKVPWKTTMKLWRFEIIVLSHNNSPCSIKISQLTYVVFHLYPIKTHKMFHLYLFISQLTLLFSIKISHENSLFFWWLKQVKTTMSDASNDGENPIAGFPTAGRRFCDFQPKCARRPAALVDQRVSVGFHRDFNDFNGNIICSMYGRFTYMTRPFWPFWG